MTKDYPHGMVGGGRHDYNCEYKYSKSELKEQERIRTGYYVKRDKQIADAERIKNGNL